MNHARPSTLADVAAAAGVSVATASRVLNGSAHKVSPGLARKVRRAAGELRYAPNVQAQNLARQASSVLAVLVRDITDPYFSQIAHGIFTEAMRRNVRVVVSETGIELNSERQRLSAMRGLRPRAAIVVGSRTVDPKREASLAKALQDLSESGATIVSVGQPGMPGACVHPRNRDAATRLAQHFSSLGHTRFAIVCGERLLQVVEDRRAGFVAGLPRTARVDTIDSEFSRDGGYRAGQQFCRDGFDATAVFVTSDVMASGFYRALREAGRDIPGDVSVAGFDDVPVAADLYPSLTTVRLPLTAMGEKACALGLDGPSEVTIPIEGELVVRDSTRRM